MKSALVCNSYQLDLAQRLARAGSASNFVVNVKRWLQILVTVLSS